MRHADLPAVLAIERNAFPTPWTAAFFEKELSTPFARLVVGVTQRSWQESVVGYTCRWRVTDEVHLLNVAVHPAWRGYGVGRRLVEAVLAEGRTTQARSVFLEVRAGNAPARRLYARLGFTELGIRRGYYGVGQDAIVMERRLGAP
jgi:ribosomal-protein-alanine N-acetyltransferase